MTITAGFPSGPSPNTNIAFANGAAVLSHSSRAETTEPSIGGGKITGPANTSRACGCNFRTKLVTTPKFPPPPRTPQKRSSFVVAFAVRISPEAVIKVTFIGENVREEHGVGTDQPQVSCRWLAHVEL